MKIATWNLQRLEKNKNQEILNKLIEIDADIVVLTETNASIKLDNYFSISTDILPNNFDGINYKSGENRTTIFTKYNILTNHKTFNTYTSVCADTETPFGQLTVYATIIGVFANKQPRFDNDLNGQLQDFEKLFIDKQVCIIGDFNVMFSCFAYPSHKARNTLNETFGKYTLTNTTANLKENVDHIVLSNDFLKGKQFFLETWNEKKLLSDHIGHCLTITN